MSFVTPPLFHSLGSNYDWRFALKAVAEVPDQLFGAPVHDRDLEAAINHYWPGKISLTYKGRDAIELALRAFGIGEGDEVLCQAFACFAIEEAIRRTGAKPVYADVAKNSLNADMATLEAAYQKAKQPKAVLIQHTLGWPAPIGAIQAWCAKKELILIADLAQAAGVSDANQVLLGNEADAIILSFGRDKIIDAITGGALILKKKLLSYTDDLPLPPQRAVVRDLCYPLLTWLIRKLDRVLIGKLLFKLGRASGLLTNPIASPTRTATQLPIGIMKLALAQLQSFPDTIRHRRKLAKIYYQGLVATGIVKAPDVTADTVTQTAAVRFPFLVTDPADFAAFCKKRHIYISDRWYRQPVDAGAIGKKSLYVAGSCPNAEALAAHLVNLPTHQGVSIKTAESLVRLVKHYMSDHPYV